MGFSRKSPALKEFCGRLREVSTIIISMEKWYFGKLPLLMITKCLLLAEQIMYLLTTWEDRMGKYLARGHGVRTKRSEVRAPLTEGQIFSHPARPNLVNKYFII